MLGEFFDTHRIKRVGSDFFIVLNFEHLKEEVAPFDIKDFEGGVIVESGRRVTSKHLKQLDHSGITEQNISLVQQEDGHLESFLLGQRLAHDVLSPNTGEVLVKANDELTEEKLKLLLEDEVEGFETLYINDLDRLPVISDTLSLDSTTSPLEAQVEIYRMMRPGEPPTAEAAEILFHNLFFNEERYDLSAVGRMKFNRRIGRDELTGPGVLSTEDILAVLRTLLDIRSGSGVIDDIDHLGNRRIRSVGEMTENQFRIGLVRVERAVKERLNLAESE
ncbi:DNA-directed RNA polymerase, beta subunit/140 kD subunit, partial [Candidatus Thiomargarita nelsonii]